MSDACCTACHLSLCFQANCTTKQCSCQNDPSCACAVVGCLSCNLHHEHGHDQPKTNCAHTMPSQLVAGSSTKTFDAFGGMQTTQKQCSFQNDPSRACVVAGCLSDNLHCGCWWPRHSGCGIRSSATGNMSQLQLFVQGMNPSQFIIKHQSWCTLIGLCNCLQCCMAQNTHLVNAGGQGAVVVASEIQPLTTSLSNFVSTM